MDQTPDSYRLSSMAHSMPEEARHFDASSTYPSPVSTTTSQGLGFSPAGLGISGCGLEPSFDHFTSFAGAIPFAASPAASNQIISTETYFAIPLRVDDFSRPSFPVYDGLPPVPNSPLSLDDSQTMTVLPSYNASIDVGEQGNFAQTPGYWAPTPCSGPTTPLEAVPATGHWNKSYFPESCITVNPPTAPVGTASYTGESRPHGNYHHHTTPLSVSPRSATSIEGVNKSRRCSNDSTDKDMHGGRKCGVCGFVFTRRSNCTEHQKRHDPSFKKIYPCDECRKTFGRNSDLRRHIESIHRGVRKYVCEWCNLKLSRHDSLVKHSIECEMRPYDASSSIRSPAKDDVNPTSASAQKLSSRRHRSKTRH